MNCKAIASCVVAAICFLLLSVFPVSADTLTINNGFYGVKDVTLTHDGNLNTMKTDVGMILVDSGGDTWAFCVDLGTKLISGGYEFTAEVPADYNSKLLYVEWLLDESADKAYAMKSNYQSAALQLAVWEILIDFVDDSTTNYGLNLASSAYVDVPANKFWYDSDSTVYNVDAWYNSYINSLISALNASGGFGYTSSGDYIVADFANNQDLIVKVVPEPTTALLLGFGLLGLCAVGRKRA